MSEENMPRFDGRVAVITGAGKGLGKAYALWLARRGCAVVVNNRSHAGIESAAQRLVDQIVQEGGTAIAHEGAVDDRESSISLVQLAIDRFGQLDILICNAGIMPEGPFADADPETLVRLVNINVMGAIYPLQPAWRHMLSRGYGRIVLTGSTVGIYGHGGVAAYGATRGAAVGLARSLTLEKPADADIGVNVILPFAYTNMSAAAMDEVLDEAMIAALQPENIAPVVGWLCSEGCRHSGKVFHSAASRVSRVGTVESAAVIVDPDNLAALSEAGFDLEPMFEPSGSEMAVGHLLGG